MMFTTHIDGRANQAPALTQDVERYIVPAGQCLGVDLFDGDRVTVMTTEGLQACELVGFNADGTCDPGVFDRRPTASPCLLQDMLETHDAISLRRGLTTRQADLASLQAIRLLDETAAPGSTDSLEVCQDGFAVFGAPETAVGSAFPIPPSDVVLLVRRSVRRRNDPMMERLPDPLGRVREEIRVDAATARAFMVRAGEYIQILDVSGRQCADIVFFDEADLDAGHVVGMSDAATRSMLGTPVPAPGLRSTIYDQRYRPTVEVVQDTVGLHDTFLTPCTAYYYDTVGYPGHTNCTDNFNGELADYGVRLDAYSAVNLFTNVDVDAGNVFVPDMSWSRAGDYVLFRAHRDLVVATSACPSDIDPVNGWNPTDIHVRVYDRDITAKRSIARVVNGLGDKAMTQDSPFHGRTSALGADYAERGGYWMPKRFAGIGTEREYWACREQAGVADRSDLKTFEIVGPGAARLMNWAVTRDVTRLAIGDVCYAAICHPHGAVLCDGLLFRVTEQNFRWTCADDTCAGWLRQEAERLGIEAWIKDSSAALCALAIQGPASPRILAKTAWTPSSDTAPLSLEPFRSAVGRIGGADGRPAVFSGTGGAGLTGFEIWCHPRDAETVWDAILEAGAEEGLAPVGQSALELLRVEAGHPAIGAEYGGDVDPFEAGIGHVVSSRKRADFCGREALASRRNTGLRRLIGLRLDSDRVPLPGCGIWNGDAQIGEITSAVTSPWLGQVIALGRVNKAYAMTGLRLMVGRNDPQAPRTDADVVTLPFVAPNEPAD